MYISSAYLSIYRCVEEVVVLVWLMTQFQTFDVSVYISHTHGKGYPSNYLSDE